MNLALRVTFPFAVLYLSLAICVLGRPQPSSALSEHSAVEVLEKGSLPSSNRLLGFLHFPTVGVPFKQERRLLKVSGGKGSRGGSFSGGGGGGGGGDGLSTTATIIIVVSTVTFVLLLLASLLWCNSKKKKNPNWRFLDYFKRKKPTAEKMFTSAKSDVDPDAAADHKMTIDVPRLDHAAKSRRQASLNHDFKNTSSLQ